MKKNNTILNVIVIALSVLVMYSCKKPPGPGGKASIKGKVYVQDFNSAATGGPITEYYAAGEKVFITYGDDNVTDDDIKTASDGAFDFQFLRKGSYKVFVLSRDTSVHVSGSNKEIPVIRTIQITDNKQVVDLGDIIINK